MTITYFFNCIINDEIVPAILSSILCCISIYILYKNTINIDKIKKYFLISFLVGIIIYIGSYILALPILSIITIIQLRNNKIKIPILVTIYLVYLANTIYVYIYGLLDSRLYNIPLKYILIQFIIMLFIIVAACLIINSINLRKKVYRQISSSQIRLRVILIITVPLCILISQIYMFTHVTDKEKIDFVMGNFVPQALPLIAIILEIVIIYYYDMAIKYEVKLKREIDEKREIEEYSHIIEDMYSETRRFKHDYMNMIIPLKEYIDNSDKQGLHKFFYDNIVDMDRNIKWNNTNIDKLKYIKVSGLKGLISTKIIKAMSINIDVKIDIIENINNISMNIMDMCRIMGILLDNAIEASQECEHPKISICIVNKNDYVVIALENNFSGNKPIIHKIYEEGFSTKGNDRGLGLYNVRNIIDKKYENVLLNTSIEKNIFIQELWIRNRKVPS